MMFWLLASGRFRVTSREDIFHECLARQEEGRISLLFTQNNATSKEEAETRPISKAAKHILFSNAQ